LVREDTEDYAYLIYRLAGGSPRGPRGTKANARGLFQVEFAVAEREATQAATSRIYLPDRDNTRLQTISQSDTAPERSKGVREGKIVHALCEQLKRIRSLYRENGWTLSQLQKSTSQECSLMWEWIERIEDAETKKEFLKVHNWDDGDKFIFRQIATLYRYAPHLTKKPEARTVFEWRKQYKVFLKHKTPNGP
jgi:hypothetical protein